jgi:creatinine amidohydrolase
MYGRIAFSQLKYLPPAMALVLSLVPNASFAQNALPVQWEELTAPDFVSAIQKAQNTCILPTGIMESHAAQLPIGTDLFVARHAAVEAAKRDYAVVFPPYYVGQTFESLEQPGDLAYSPSLQLQLLQETTDEMARNGCKKILIVNAHGGNNSLLSYFAQIQPAKPRDYAVYIMSYPKSQLVAAPGRGSHADSEETSLVMVIRPDLVHVDRAKTLNGGSVNRLQLPPGLATGIFPYANHPDHYNGDGSLASKALGEEDWKIFIDTVLKSLQFVKADQATLKIQREFYEKTGHPLDTKPYASSHSGPP